MDETEAKTMATSSYNTARQQLQASRQAASRAQKQDMGFAWLEIIGGIALLIAGLAAGWFVGLFLVPIIDGIRRLGS